MNGLITDPTDLFYGKQALDTELQAKLQDLCIRKVIGVSDFKKKPMERIALFINGIMAPAQRCLITSTVTSQTIESKT